MRPDKFSTEAAKALILKRKIASFPELMAALGTGARRTVFRKLKALACRASYSHRGQYYTLDEVARFDSMGLWSHRGVWFSVRGSLLNTARGLVEASDCGYFASELDHVLHVETRDALPKLVRLGGLSRERLGGQFLYCAAGPDLRKRQVLARRALLAEPGIVGGLPEPSILPDELRAAIVLFFSLLDERQRRWYAGLEALKSGRGGDVRIAELLGLDVGTVARGRRELLAQDAEVDRVRKPGGGRRPVKKKRRK